MDDFRRRGDLEGELGVLLLPSGDLEPTSFRLLASEVAMRGEGERESERDRREEREREKEREREHHYQELTTVNPQIYKLPAHWEL